MLSHGLRRAALCAVGVVLVTPAMSWPQTTAKRLVPGSRCELAWSQAGPVIGVRSDPQLLPRVVSFLNMGNEGGLSQLALDGEIIFVPPATQGTLQAIRSLPMLNLNYAEVPLRDGRKVFVSPAWLRPATQVLPEIPTFIDSDR